MSIEIELFPVQRQFMAALLDPDIEQIGYGGARGGGKSHVLRVALIVRCLMFPGSKHLLLRRTHDDVVKQHVPEIKKLLHDWKIDYRYNQTLKIFYLPHGSELHLGFAEFVKHAEKYAGLEYLTIAFDEATHFEEIIYDRITGSARVAVEGGPKIKKIITCNPGGIGHAWIKKRFVKDYSRDQHTVWIAAKLCDNVVLGQRDPGYGDRLTRGLPEWMRRQWLDGDWDASESQYFSVPSGVVQTIEPPRHARWYAGVDWGYFPSSFGVLWAAAWKDLYGQPHFHVYAELKQKRLDLDEQARRALEMEEMLPEPPRIRFADPATGKRIEGETDEAGRTVTRVWAKNGFFTSPARRHGRVPGWMLLRQMMAPLPNLAAPGQMLDHGILTIAPGCMALLAELENASFEMKGGVIVSDDLDGEDHLLDPLRYMLVMIFGLDFARQLQSAYIPTGGPQCPATPSSTTVLTVSKSFASRQLDSSALTSTTP